MKKTAVLLFIAVVSSTLISTGYNKNSQDTGYSSNVSYKAEEISKSYKEADDFLESLELKTYEEIPDPLTLELVTEIDPYFDPYDLRAKSNLSAEDINKKLEGTGLAGLGESYKKAEETENVNAAFLIALTAWESSWGNKTIAENNGVHEKLITVNCYPIPDEKYDELKKFVDSNNIVMSSKDDIIFLLFKYTNPEEF